jgi:hypothetical protein
MAYAAKTSCARGLYCFEYGRLAIVMVDDGDQGGERDKGAKSFVIALSRLFRFVPWWHQYVNSREINKASRKSLSLTGRELRMSKC